MTLRETASSGWSATEGLPFPLGPTKIEEEDAYNFALYSKHAESVTLLLYTERDIVNPVFEYQFDYLKNKTGRIWHCRIPFVSIQGALYYAYRVDGPAPNGRFEWHGFDRDKILARTLCKIRVLSPVFDRLAAIRLVRTRARRPRCPCRRQRAL